MERWAGEEKSRAEVRRLYGQIFGSLAKRGWVRLAIEKLIEIDGA